MQTYRRGTAALGLLLVLPLAGAVVASVDFMADCDYDCGDQGGRGLFLLVLLCTPPAAAGVLTLAVTVGRSHRVARLATKLVVAGVVSCTLVLIGVAIAAAAAAVDRLINGDQGREPALFMLIVAVVLTAMATAAALSLRAAWRKRR